MTVINMNGAEIDYESAVELMDDDIREQVHEVMTSDDRQVFFLLYEVLHWKKYGAPWELSKENPVW